MINKFKKRFLNIKSGLLLFSLVPTFLMMCIISTAISANQWQKCLQKTESNLSKATLEINSIFEQGSEFSSNTVSNTYILSLFEKQYSDLEMNFDTFHSLDMFFTNYKEKNSSTQNSIRIYHNNYSMYRNEYSNYLDSMEPEILKKLESFATKDTLWTEDDDFFCLYKASNTPELSFVIKYSIPKSKLNKILKTFEVMLNEDYDFQNSVSFYQREPQNMSFSKKLYNGWYLGVTVPSSLKHYIYIKNIILYMLIFALISLVIVIFSNMYSSGFKKAVSEFIDSIEPIGTASDTTPIIKKDDTLSPVYSKIIKLINQVNELHEKSARITSEKNVIELKYIQSQFNPHLLYNTLSVLKWDCMKFDAELGKAISTMTAYYRACISPHDEVVTFSTEVELVKKYISLMEFTHKKCYPLIVNMDSSLSHMKTIKHLLQPFAENSILHGIQQIPRCYIKIDIIRDNDTAVISISDNGVGIDKNKMNEIKSDNYFSKYKSYGIKNTRERIRLFHGKESGLDISSRPGGGTCVTIRVPIGEFEDAENMENNV